jgi:hypothetical protein
MNVGINHGGFGNTERFGLGKLLQQEIVIREKIEELKRVTDILAVKVWTKDDVDSSYQRTGYTDYLNRIGWSISWARMASTEQCGTPKRRRVHSGFVTKKPRMKWLGAWVSALDIGVCGPVLSCW